MPCIMVHSLMRGKYRSVIIFRNTYMLLCQMRLFQNRKAPFLTIALPQRCFPSSIIALIFILLDSREESSGQARLFCFITVRLTSAQSRL